ncbi:recombination repair protein 1 [Drosophila grimshawi]|uniref:recombination repair protein 1 n=1 Tax=Drosophila grimshawi TaxID=7222 RepID=UPI000C86E4CA|nr:recombination repair protein 1 [Drosophila grimshawi]
MPRAKVAKKATASELLATNGNDASSSTGTAGIDLVADAIKQPPKSKARGKKMAAATAAGEANDAEANETEVVKKTASRGKKKETEKEEVVVEVAELPKPRGRTRRPTTKVSEAEPPKTKITKSRAKKDKTPAPEETELSKGRAKKDKAFLKEEDGVALIKETASKARGRKIKEAEQNDATESAEPSAAGRAKKDVSVTATKSKAQIAETDAPPQTSTTATAAATTKRARAAMHLATIKMTAVLEVKEDQKPEDELASNKRARSAKTSNENAEVPVKKRGRKVASVEAPPIEMREVPAPSTSRKRAQKRVNEEQDEELNVPKPTPESKPARGRKRQAAVIEEDADAIAADAADGSKMSKTKKPTTQKVDAAGSYDKSLFTSPTDKTFNLKISSWNVAGLRAWLKKDGLKFVEVEEPDIFCLQETKCINDQLPDEITRLAGYHPYWLCMPGGYAGVAIYSKVMPINVEYGIGNQEFDDVGRMITAEYEKYFLINVYVPNSGRKLVNLEMRMRWEKLFQAYVQKLDARKPVVICGDMNVSHLEIDLANPKANTRNAGFTKEERDKMTELLSLGYVDTFRQLYPDRTGAYTFWTYMSNSRARNVGWRLDYCIVSERFVPRIVDNVMRSHCLGSDHCPITVFLNV